MSTKIAWPWELPKTLDGVGVVCDVWGATTNITTLLEKDPAKLFIVNTDNVGEAKKKYKDALVIGESLKLPKTFFDASNYPSDVAKIEAKNRIVLYMSNNGSRIIELVFEKKAHNVITISFTNIGSVNKWLASTKENIYLVPAGDTGSTDPKVVEDLVCVQTLDKMLKRGDVDLDQALEKAKSFIVANYGYQNFDQDSNFKIVFNLNSSKVVPLCEREKEGWISIKDFN